MTHYLQRERARRLAIVADWLTHATPKAVINFAMREFGCTRRKAVEYVAEATE